MAITCNICKLAGLPFAYTYILLRMTNMLMYVIVVFFAVRKLPKGKLIMSAIALMPTPMYLACTISYDTVVTGFLFLGMAYLFYLMFTDKKLTWWEYLVFIGGMAYGSSRKSIYIPLILLGVFLPHRIFKDKKQERIMKTGVIVILLLILSTFVLPAIISPSTRGRLKRRDNAPCRAAGQCILQSGRLCSTASFYNVAALVGLRNRHADA